VFPLSFAAHLAVAIWAGVVGPVLAEPVLSSGGDSDPVQLGIMAGYPLSPEKQATLENWLEFPINRWAFRNLRALFPTGAVAPGGTAEALAYGPELDLNAVTFLSEDGTTQTAAQYFAGEYVDGFIVLHRGRIVYEGYFASMQPEEAHLWQSMTKSITGLMAEMLARNGDLDLSQTAGHYVPEIASTVWGQATLRDLLDMEVNVREPTTRAAQLPKDFWRTANFKNTLMDPAAEQAGENGQVWYCTNSAPTALGLVMTSVTGKSWHRLAQDLVWSRIGPEAEGNIWLDTDGQGAAAGGFSSTLRDAARLAEFVRRGGAGLPLEAEAIDALRSPAGNAALTSAGNVAMLNLRPEMSYKSYWYQVNDGDGSLEALGIFGQHMYVNPAAEISIVQFASYPTPAPNPMNWTNLAAAIVAELKAR
jgi:CubicO group peptidase (beta-lactamase class C family)